MEPPQHAQSWGHSSIGRARRSQCRGWGFDPPCLHHPHFPGVNTDGDLCEIADGELTYQVPVLLIAGLELPYLLLGFRIPGAKLTHVRVGAQLKRSR